MPVLKSGLLQGILTSKGEAWVEVKDDNGYNHRYLAPWKGKGPSRGGSFSAQIIQLIDSLVVGNRVILKWYWDNHLRVENVELIMPAWEDELFEGYVLKIGDKWVDVQNKDEGVPWRFYLPWVGGYPSSGGGYDQSILDPLREHEPTSPIIFEWEYELRPRIKKLFTREEVTTKAFYEVDEIPPWLGPRVPVKEFSPFDLIVTKEVDNSESSSTPNPFDEVVGNSVNPFDSVETVAANPFATIASQQVGSSINPFDSAGKKSFNPFSASVQKSVNPFEQSVTTKKDKFEDLINRKLEEIILPIVEFKNLPLPEALSKLAQKSSEADQGPEKMDIRIFFETVEKTDTTKISLNLQNVKLSDALDQVVKETGWSYQITSGFVFFSNPKNFSKKSPFEKSEKKPESNRLNPFEQAEKN